MNYRFPENFMWGVGGSAFQMEGAMLEGGKTMNVFEAGFHTEEPQELFLDSRAPDEYLDFYYKYRDDMKLIGQLSPVTFRYSIAWARIIPEKDAAPNKEGIDFYNNVINEMLANGITPFIDLYHSDLPLWVIEAGGIANREFIQWYTRYAEVCFREFGDRVKFWSTANEPSLSIFEAYANARHMPYERDISRAMLATHHMVLAHFESVRILRKMWPDAKIGMVNNTGENYCLSFEEEDIAAARRKVAYRLIFSDPIILGEYPKELLDYPPVSKYFTEDLLREVKEKFVPMDFYGINYYCPYFARSGNKSLIGTENFDGGLPKDGYNFSFYAPAMFDILFWLNERYHGLDLFITENGYADQRPDENSMELDALQHDEGRIKYIREHVRECARLLKAGVNLKGYFYWSIMDSWEMRYGFKVPMGLIGVNYVTHERRPRDSYYYYQKIIQNNMVD